MNNQNHNAAKHPLLSLNGLAQCHTPAVAPIDPIRAFSTERVGDRIEDMTSPTLDNLGTFEEESARGGYQPIRFEADAALIRELGERLVGAPHIALAELVKNAYDADATTCTILLERNRIVISDNGHGMTEEEFRDLWMTIGSTHKRQRSRSRDLARLVTGSKGVGRLSAQFLAHKLQLLTRSSSGETIHALVDWDEASVAGRLTSAKARFRIEADMQPRFAAGGRVGTTVILEKLKHTWAREEVRELGRQLWMLNSPFAAFGRLASGKATAENFDIQFRTVMPGVDETFSEQIRSVLNDYHAAVEGSLRREGDSCVSHVRIQFRDGDSYQESFRHPALIEKADWQVRIYNLIGRQESGVTVGEAREYFKRFGVMVFDAGFRLPYYGTDNDWLKVERDHSHRLTTSKLLPQRLQFDRGLNDLPTQDRMMGVVSINTGAEAQSGSINIDGRPPEHLQILVTRDRLVDNAPYKVLRDAVRQSLDLYATRQRRRASKDELRAAPFELPSVKLRKIDELIGEAVHKFGYDDTITTLRDEFASLDVVVREQERADDAARALLGPLASAGMAALAMEHENRRKIQQGRIRLERLRAIAEERSDPEMASIVNEFQAWLDSFDDARRIFAPLLEGDERGRTERYRAFAVIREVISSIDVLLPRVEIENAVGPVVSLPEATFAEWHALLQNILTNAANATLDVASPKVRISAHRQGRRTVIRVSDNGKGVDLAGQAQLFEPFERRLKLSDERSALGLGGLGMGLTIVRMIAAQRGCGVAFVDPELGWNTTFELSWVERHEDTRM